MSTRRPFYGLLTAYLVSGVGTAMSEVAVPWLVLVTTGSAASTGVVGFSLMTPYVVLQATAGPLVDRVGPRRTFLLGNAAAAIATGAIPLLHALGGLSLATLACVVAVAGAVRGVADCATTPMVPITADQGDVPYERAVGLFSGANRAAMLAGMPLAGVLIVAFGPAQVILLDAVSFGAAVIVLGGSVPARPGSGNSTTEPMRLGRYFAELREGLHFLRADRLLVGIVIMVAVTNLLDQALTSVLLPVWAHDRVHDATALGWVGGAWGAGMLVGALGGAWLGPRLPRWPALAFGSLLSASPPFFALAGWASVPWQLPVFALTGVVGGVLNPILGAVEFERIPPRLHARVLGAIKASAWVGIPFGALVGGALAQGPGLTTALLACGSAMLLATLAPFVFPSWRTVDRRGEQVVRASPANEPATHGQLLER